MPQEIKNQSIPKEIVAEMWSRTVMSTSLFTSGTETKVWDLKPGEEWEAIPDEHSQADFVIKPGQTLKFPDQITQATRKDGVLIKIDEGQVANDGSDKLVLTVVGMKLKVNRQPDEYSGIPKPVDIDHW